MSKYKAVIGLEMHCEMKSNTKVFSSAKNSYSDIANINVNPVDMAFPGILPVLNKECVRKAIMAALILNCKVPEYMYFDRKNYYYPDLPKDIKLLNYMTQLVLMVQLRLIVMVLLKKLKFMIFTLKKMQHQWNISVMYH